MDFDFVDDTGYLVPEPRIHDCTIDDVRLAFVRKFPKSGRRKRIFGAYRAHSGAWRRIVAGGPFEQWLDGSFTTLKPDPQDMDFIGLFPQSVLGALPGEQYNELRRLFPDDHTEGGLLHAFLLATAPAGSPEAQEAAANYAWWLNWFSHDEEGVPKGFLRIHVEGEGPDES